MGRRLTCFSRAAYMLHHQNQTPLYHLSLSLSPSQSFLLLSLCCCSLMAAFRTVASAKLTSPSLSCAPRPSKPAPNFVSLPPLTSTALSLLSLFSSPNEAKAFAISKDQIASSLTDVENAINGVVQFGSSVFGYSQQLVEVVKPGVEVAVPALQKAGEKALEISSPAISGVLNQALDAVQSTGLDLSPVLGVAKTIVNAAQEAPKVIEGAKPIASATVETITSSDPQTVVVISGAAVLSYFFLPPLWSAVSFNLRGYRGDLTPAQTLDMLTRQNYLMIDIRSEKDKSKAGIPQPPSDAKNKMISIPLEELPSKIRGLVRNVKKVEAEIAAVKISFLKKLSKSSNIVIMDSYADSAKIVAKTLTGLGFKNCWIMLDGFSGGRGWSQSRLGTDSYNSLVEVLSPSRIIPETSAILGTTSFQSTRKLLPGGD